MNVNVEVHKPADCEKAIVADKGDGWLLSGYRQDGEVVACPVCGTEWQHLCDEAEGCRWIEKEYVA